ncbi:MAG: 3'-5' exonuclease domain-containing protein 2 [Rikenellaceae bacterium]|nr:3'-5' exonuclease domain-containing protein 2 [Rikenellaceae bacterium]
MSLYPETISKEELETLPKAAFNGRIIVIDRQEDVAEACSYLLAQEQLGFDTESRAAFQKGVVNKIALLQLSTNERCYLFRLCRIRLDKAILKILESPQIRKVGLATAGDIKELFTLRKFRARNFIDLQTIVGDYGIKELGLTKISGIVLGQRVAKAQRLSNWESSQLTEAQQVYAATDAWVCSQIYDKLTQQ